MGQWNVKDIGVFSELSQSAVQSAGMLDDIRREVDDAIDETKQVCNEALEELESRRRALASEIREQRSQSAVNGVALPPSPEEQEAKSRSQEKIERIEEAKGKIVELCSHIDDARQEYERSFLSMRDAYEQLVRDVETVMEALQDHMEKAQE